MNLYILLAIALGAITGATDTSIVRPAFVLSRGEGSGVRQRRIAESRLVRRVVTAVNHHVSRVPAVAAEVFFRAGAPLSGAATPRAPASNC